MDHWPKEISIYESAVLGVLKNGYGVCREPERYGWMPITYVAAGLFGSPLTKSDVDVAVDAVSVLRDRGLVRTKTDPLEPFSEGSLLVMLCSPLDLLAEI